MNDPKHVEMAKRFHELYEELAPSFGYETRQETRAFDPDSPNGRLMTEVVGRLIDRAAGLPELEARVEELKSQLATAQHIAFDLQMERDALAKRLEAVITLAKNDCVEWIGKEPAMHTLLRLARGEE